MFNQKLTSGAIFLAQSLHGTRPLVPNHHHFTLTVVSHPLENTPHAKCSSDYEPEGREFESLRAHHSLPRFTFTFYKVRPQAATTWDTPQI